MKVFRVSGTHTVAALEYARNSAFKPEFGDREDVDNYVILVTDGVSYDSVDIGNGRTTLDLAATLLKELTAKAVSYTQRIYFLENHKCNKSCKNQNKIFLIIAILH